MNLGCGSLPSWLGSIPLFACGVFGDTTDMNNPHKVAPLLRKGAPPISNRSDSWKIAPNLLSSCCYAANGIQYAFQTQRNFRIQVGLAMLGFSLLTWVQASVVDFCLVLLLVALVMSLELVNTALEAVVDLTVGSTYHELAIPFVYGFAQVAGLILGCILVIPQVWWKLIGML